MRAPGRTAIICLALLMLPACGDRASARLLLGTTHTLEDSRILDVLTRAFNDAHPEHDLDVLVAGSGEILTMAQRGDLDVLLTHSPDDEIAFIAAGRGQARLPVMYNDFVLLGPRADPVRAAGAASPGAALRSIAGARAPFVSRGDESGTHRKERALWADAQIIPDWPDYIESGAGMADALRLASQRGAYILADRATFEVLRADLALDIIFEGSPLLINQYSVIVVTEAANRTGADAFAAWVRSDAAQQLIARYGRTPGGRPLFSPGTP